MTTQIEIPAPAAQVFDVLADGWSFCDWVVGAASVRTVDPGFPAVGSRVHHCIGTRPVSIDDVTEVVGVDPPTYLKLRASMGPAGVADITFELAETGRGTVVTMTEDVLGTDAVARLERRAELLLRVRNSEVLWRLRRLVEQRVGTADRGDPLAPPGLPAALERALVRLFASVASLRRARSLHPRGLVLEGRATLHDATSPLGVATELQAVVRLSRGAGLPDPLPDFDGVAVRLLDAHGADRHQDLLFTAAGSAPLLRHVIRPVRSFGTGGFSTVLPYRHRDHGLVLFRVDPLPVASLEQAAAHLPFEVQISAASLLGRWRPIATVEVTTAVEDELETRFDPWRTGPDLLPSGLLNRARLPAYAGSRAVTANPSPAAPATGGASG